LHTNAEGITDTTEVELCAVEWRTQRKDDLITPREGDECTDKDSGERNADAATELAEMIKKRRDARLSCGCPGSHTPTLLLLAALRLALRSAR
jgi:hypothetical protein